MRRLLLVLALVLGSAAPVAAQGWRATAFGGFGSDEAYAAGAGVSVGRTLSGGFYLGARAAIHGGGDRDIEVESG